MSKSLCIKTNNSNVIEYLLNNFSNLPIKDLYITKSKFKIYNNIIVHYKGNVVNDFYFAISTVLTNTIVNFYENRIIKNILTINYFYFSDFEQNKILNTCLEYLKISDLRELQFKHDSIFLSCYNYISNNKSLVLNGFIDFRLKEYIKILDSIVDIAVNKFVIDKEYIEFINLLKTYISSKEYNSSTVHLIYSNSETLLLDANHNLIDFDNNYINRKYLSDISFSSNDLALNTLLNLLPEKIFIHILDIEDEFITTLKLIFDSRIHICNNCDICNIYKNISLH